MPRIFLKPNSPEFASSPAQARHKHCDMPDCRAPAEHKAPKDRALGSYYHFCIEHVREYNKAWNFFEGMSDREAQEHMHKSFYGDRPTWKYGVNGDAEDALYRRAWQSFHFTDKEPPKSKKEHQERKKRSLEEHKNTPEYEALAIMELSPPVTPDQIKARYRALVKMHHPDLNGGCLEAVERLKQINMAYTVLKLSFEKFEKLEDL